MIPILRSEFRKILTVRSTYVLLAIAAALMIFASFYIGGFKATADASGPAKLASQITSTAQFVSLVLSLIAVLNVTHEYRFNTIMHSLVSAQHRWFVLLAKLIAVTTVIVAATIVLCLLAPLMTRLGLQLHHVDLVKQSIPFSDLLPRSVFYVWGFAIFGFLIAAVTRSTVASILSLYLIPSVLEIILSLVLKDNAIYLPFIALSQVLVEHVSVMSADTVVSLTHASAAVIVLIYIAVVGAIGTMLFIRRDAN